MSNGTKTIGARTAMAFAMECMKRGATVSEPFGDDAPYDLLVDSGESIRRVQVKTAAVVKKAGELKKDKSGNRYYHVNTQRIVPGPDGKSKAIPYKEGDIDVIVTQAGDIWYLIGEPHKLPGGIAVYPHSAAKNKYEKWRARWDLVDLQSEAEAYIPPTVEADDEAEVDEGDAEDRPPKVEPPFVKE